MVGGGPTGVELAGELVTDFEAKEVIVVQSGPRLLPSIKEKLGKFAQKFLESKGAKVRSVRCDELTRCCSQGHGLQAWWQVR